MACCGKRTLVQTVVEATVGIAEAVLAPVSEAVQRERRRICADCVDFDPHWHLGRPGCRGCGCFLTEKWKSHRRCCRGLWGGEDGAVG